MDFLPKELSNEQAQTMKNILDQQLIQIHNDRSENQQTYTPSNISPNYHQNTTEVQNLQNEIYQDYTPNNINPIYNQNTTEANNLQSEIYQLQNKILSLENKLTKKVDLQQPEDQYQIKVQQRPHSQQSPTRTEYSQELQYKPGPRSKSRQIRDAALRRIESSEKILDDLEKSFSESIHSDVSKNSRRQSPIQSQWKKTRSRKESPKQSFSDIRTVEKMKQELAQERSKRIKVQKELSNIQHTLKVKQSVVTQFNNLKDSYNDLYLQFERSEKIRLQQKELIGALKEELISLREENENFTQQAYPKNTSQPRYIATKTKKSKKVTRK